MQSEIVTVTGKQYRKATWSRRIVARFIDISLAIGVCVVGGDSLLPLSVLASIFYLLLGNAFLNGQSIGKRLTGMKIIDARHGGPCSVIQDLLRHRYLFFGNPLFLLLTAYDSSQGCFDKPELYVVLTSPLTLAECEMRLEKPAKLDLAGMRAMVQQTHNERVDANKPPTD